MLVLYLTSFIYRKSKMITKGANHDNLVPTSPASLAPTAGHSYSTFQPLSTTCCWNIPGSFFYHCLYLTLQQKGSIETCHRCCDSIAQNLQWSSILLRVNLKELTKNSEALLNLGIHYSSSNSLAYSVLGILHHLGPALGTFTLPALTPRKFFLI